MTKTKICLTANPTGGNGAGDLERGPPIQSRIPYLAVGVLSVLLSSLAGAQDVDVPNNLTMRDSTDAATGNILKEGVLFLHNFGTDNTFIGANAGNLMTSGSGRNAAIGAGALQSNTTGRGNTV